MSVEDRPNIKKNNPPNGLIFCPLFSDPKELRSLSNHCFNFHYAIDPKAHVAVITDIKTWDSESRVILQIREELFFTEERQLINRMKK